MELYESKTIELTLERPPRRGTNFALNTGENLMAWATIRQWLEIFCRLRGHQADWFPGIDNLECLILRMSMV